MEKLTEKAMERLGSYHIPEHGGREDIKDTPAYKYIYKRLLLLDLIENLYKPHLISLENGLVAIMIKIDECGKIPVCYYRELTVVQASKYFEAVRSCEEFMR